MKNSKLIITFSILILISFIVFADDIKTIEILEGELVDLEVFASDPDEDELFYVYDPPLDDEGKWQTNYGDYGEYLTKITVSDGIINTIQEVKIKLHKLQFVSKSRER